MPKYEIGYILSSTVSDDEVPDVVSEVARSIESSGGRILNEDHWGRKKLAYPIGRTRNGYYVFVAADLQPEKIAEIEHKLNTMEPVIRFLIVNQTEADRRRAKDEEMRAKRPARNEEKPADAASDANNSGVDIEQEIDKAISSEDKQ